MLETYYTFLGVMAVVAVIVFVALHFVEAGYGYLFDARFGRPVSNKVGWVLMESPVFVAMCLLWALSDVRLRRHRSCCSSSFRPTISTARSSSRCACVATRRCRWALS